MEEGKNSVIYMGLVLGPNKADNICGKMKVTGTMQLTPADHIFLKFIPGISAKIC